MPRIFGANLDSGSVVPIRSHFYPFTLRLSLFLYPSLCDSSVPTLPPRFSLLLHPFALILRYSLLYFFSSTLFLNYTSTSLLSLISLPLSLSSSHTPFSRTLLFSSLLLYTSLFFSILLYLSTIPVSFLTFLT